VRQPDIALARARLGWEPRVGLAEGLGRTVDYFRAELEARGAKVVSGHA
jgi:dTDP-glucose 4,6-dehydratase